MINTFVPMGSIQQNRRALGIAENLRRFLLHHTSIDLIYVLTDGKVRTHKKKAVAKLLSHLTNIG